MSLEYVALDEFKTFVGNKTKPEEDAFLLNRITSASRAIEDYLDVAEGYFFPPPEATTRKVLGRGASYLSLPAPLFGEVTITAPEGYTVPNFDITDELRLITLDSGGVPSLYITWGEVYYTITGFWGYEAIPAQIVEATLQLAEFFYRSRDKALSGTITSMGQDEQFPERDYPRKVRRILDEYKRKLGGKPGGGLYFA